MARRKRSSRKQPNAEAPRADRSRRRRAEPKRTSRKTAPPTAPVRPDPPPEHVVSGAAPSRPHEQPDRVAVEHSLNAGPAPVSAPARSSRSPSGRRAIDLRWPPPLPSWLRVGGRHARHALAVCITHLFAQSRYIARGLHPLALLTGMAVGWQWSGLRATVLSTLDPLPTTTAMTAVIALLCAAVGPWLPERLASPINRLIRDLKPRTPDPPDPDHPGPVRRGNLKPEAMNRPEQARRFWVLRALHEHDAPLNWLLLSMLALTAGCVSLLTLAMMPAFSRFHAFMLERFFWTSLTLAAFEWISVAVVIGACWMIHGLVIATLSPVVRRHGTGAHTAASVSAGVLVGLGAAFALRPHLTRWEISGGQELMLGVMVMFTVAALAVRVSQRGEGRPPSTEQATPSAPEVSPRAEGLIWLLIAVWGFATMLCAAGWLRSRSLVDPTSHADGVGTLCLGMVVGLIAASLHAARRPAVLSGPSGCGMAVWAAGLGAGAAVTAASWTPDSRWGIILALLALAVPAGFALHYLERAWLARAGSGAPAFAQFASAVCTGSAVGLIAAEWWAVPALGAVGAMAAASLLMLVTGGLMQIHEHDRPVRIRHQRLAMVFASLAAAIVVFPDNTQRWSRWARVQAAQRELPTDLAWLAQLDPFRTRELCLIGVDPAEVPGALDGIQRAAVMPLSRATAAPVRWPQSGDNPRVFHTNAFRTLQIERGRYRLIYQQSPAVSPTSRFGEYALEWFDRLAHHIAPGGHLIVDIPLESMTRQGIVVIAATFRTVVDDPAHWKLTYANARPVLRLTGQVGGPAGSASASGPQRASTASTRHEPPGLPLDLLIPHTDTPRPHSVARDRLTSALRRGASDTTIGLIAWLAEKQAAGSPSRHPED